MTPSAIRAAREQLGLTQGRAAYLFGVQRRTWCRWEAGEWPIQRAAGVLLQLAAEMPAVRERVVNASETTGAVK